MRRKGILLRAHAFAPGERDFDKHLFDSYTHDPSNGGAWPRRPGLPDGLPDVFEFSKYLGSTERFGIQCL